jgi:dephospho-CoA kinase
MSPSSSTGSASNVARATVVGLTGAPAAGKTTVAALLASAGCHVIDVDRLGHQALETCSVRDAVVAEFGSHVLADDGSLDRGALARVAFADDLAIARLEGLVHPVVRDRLTAAIITAEETATRAIVIDAALLFEGKLDALCDVTVVVDAPESARAERARAERGWDDGEFARRQARQISADEKRGRAGHVLVNDAGIDRLRERTLALLETIAPVALTNDHTIEYDAGR